MQLRPFQPDDTDAVIDLIDTIYHEYGDRVHLGKSEADLKEISAHFAPGHFMVLDDRGAVVGTVAIAPDAVRSDTCLLKRLYLDARLRGDGRAEEMVSWAKDTARSLGMTRMALWSDVRFTRAHRFYTKLGFQHNGETRCMDDGWTPYREYLYSIELY